MAGSTLVQGSDYLSLESNCVKLLELRFHLERNGWQVLIHHTIATFKHEKSGTDSRMFSDDLDISLRLTNTYTAEIFAINEAIEC